MKGPHENAAGPTPAPEPRTGVDRRAFLSICVSSAAGVIASRILHFPREPDGSLSARVSIELDPSQLSWQRRRVS